jgi:uncharacterized protein (TIGR00255 family)
MIHSMTAFARAQSQGDWGSAICEIRSVNHRYLEIRAHLPDILFELEQPMHDYIRKHVKRGKVECYLRFQPGAVADTPLQINHGLVKRLVLAQQEINALFPAVAAPNVIEVLQWPGVIQSSDSQIKGVEQEMMGLLANAVNDLLATRSREGEELKSLFLQRLDSMKSELAKARAKIPSVLQYQRDRLIRHFSEAQVELDNQRLEQEMVMFAQKIDVTEEIDRIDTHVAEVKRVLKQGGAIGRRLDFLMQELNREANTLGAKSVDVDMTHASLEMKVLIEQLREQMQNIE